jgi:hypothetical protein
VPSTATPSLSSSFSSATTSSSATAGDLGLVQDAAPQAPRRHSLVVADTN